MSQALIGINPISAPNGGAARVQSVGGHHEARTVAAINAITRVSAAMCAFSVPGADDSRWRQPGEPRF